jgi:hypothetical protein
LAAFVEYTLFKELRSEANIVLLENAVREGLRLTSPEERETLKAIHATRQNLPLGAALYRRRVTSNQLELIQRIKWGIGKNEVVGS